MNQEVSKLESYSKAIAEKMCNSFFSSSEAINGEQILSFTSIDQINLFVLKNLFQRWKEEVKKLKSPYFNYESTEIKESLDKFMNSLSRNIHIKKEFYKPLLEKAVLDSLFLIFKPELYFRNEYPSRVLVSELKEVVKYYRLYKSALQSFIENAERGNKKEVESDELIVFVQQAFRNEEELRNSYLEKLAAILPFEIREEKKEVEPEVPVIVKPVEQVQKTDEVITQQSKVQSVSAAILNEKFSATQLTLNDVLKQEQSGSLADKISKSKIENIRTAISLSQKFLFVQSLFKGDSSVYENALNDINKSSNYNEAMDLLSTSYASKYQWDFATPEVKEFISIVERKFY